MNFPERPEESIQRLISTLEPIGDLVSVAPRKRLNFEHRGRPHLHIFKKGEVSILRASDGLLVASCYEPVLFGLAEFFQPECYYILRSETECDFIRIDADTGFKNIINHSLWRDVAILLSYFNSYLSYRNMLVVQQRTYLVIRNHLLELFQLPLSSRLKTSILEYIQNRTFLSRSSICNVIFSLRNDGYIEVMRGGYLIALKNLPDKF